MHTATEPLTVQTMTPGTRARIISGPFKGALVERLPDANGCGARWPRVRRIGYDLDADPGSVAMASETGVHPETAVVPVRMR